ncbi:MAG: M20/M25/M40 family metallo-hydrolase [Bacteroidales bacterium]
MKKLFFSTLAVIALFTGYSDAQENREAITKGLAGINQQVLRAQLGFIASDWTEGREAGQKGEFIAADYIASMLQLYGVKPGGDFPRPSGYSNIQEGKDRTYFQNFVLLKTSPGDEQVMKIKSSEGEGTISAGLAYNIDFTMRSPESDVEIEAPVIFAGYGFVSEKLRYNDFSKLDIRGKFVLRISGTPGFAKESLSPNELYASAGEAEKYARSMGAAGIIEFNPNSAIIGSQLRTDPFNLSPSENNPRYGRAYANYSIPVKDVPDHFMRISVSAKVAREIMNGSGFDPDSFIKKSASSGNSVLPLVKGKSIYVKATVKSETIRVRNVIGVIDGINPNQYIVLGAHYDHLGMNKGYLWNGADDNGSGTVGVLTIAKAFMESGVRPQKTMIFAFWTAEEEGLLGSRYYVDNLQVPAADIRLNLNFDMISRYIADDDPDKVVMTYTESYPQFRDITEKNMKEYRIALKVDYQPSKDPPGGSDHRSFSAAGIPVMRFKPGHREEYHTPADEVTTVNWDIMEKIIRISFVNAWVLANTDW